LLERENLWDLVSNSTLAIVGDDETATLERERLKKKALSIINLAVRDCVVPYILDIEDPTVCWERLKNLYATNNNARRMLLRRKLTNLKMEEGTMMSTFLQSVQDLVNQLAGIGEKIPDEEIAEHMLTALPELYEPLVSSVAYRTEMPTLSELTALLLNEKCELQSGKARSCLCKPRTRGTSLASTVVETISIPANRSLHPRKWVPVTSVEARITL
jgi:hypothetical protein